MSSSSSKSSQARLREALTAGAPTAAKGPPVADGVLSVTPDTTEAIEWRSKTSLVDSIASTSSFLDDSDDGPQTSQLYGKFTWRLEKFSEGGKRELRSNVFEVGSFKWYLLVYPQGCDVANHLSLFLCVADYDKLLPGWSHFAQFTIAVVNADPRKSKYSDTLHRFTKKEHDWGWKKFMELGKVLDGFTVADTLVIKAQVQVIRDRPQRPFRCLEAQYRRELARVYLANVEGIARRYCDEQREYLGRLLEEGRGFKAFWQRLTPARQRQLSTEPVAAVLKAVVKRLFSEREVTSTLVMDALYCGAKLLEAAGRLHLEGREAGGGACNGAAASEAGGGACNGAAASEAGSGACNGAAAGEAGGGARSGAAAGAAAGGEAAGGQPWGVLIDARRGVFFFAGDAVSVLQRALADVIPPGLADQQQGEAPLRTAQESDEYSREAVERDELRLADLGRRCVELCAAAHIAAAHMEAAHAEAETIKRQEALLFEEEQREREEGERQAARAEAERERRAKKKERTRRKKEAERAKQEAEEAERAQQEEARRLEQQRRHQEAEERRRREEAEREQDLQRQRAAKQAAEAKRQQQEAAKRARQEQAAAAAAARQQLELQQQAGCVQLQAAERDGSSSSGGSSVSGFDEPAQAQAQPPLSRAASEASVDQPGSLGRFGSSHTGTLTPPSTAASRVATPEPANAAAAPAAAAGGEPPPPAEVRSPASASEGGSEGTADDDADALRRQVAWLTGLLATRDARIVALQARVGELEGRLAATGASVPPSSSAPSSATSAAASRPDSAASHQRRPSSSGDEAAAADMRHTNGGMGGTAAAAAARLRDLPTHSSGLLAGATAARHLASPAPPPARSGVSATALRQVQPAVPANTSGARNGVPSMNPAAQQFNPAAAPAFGGAKQPALQRSSSSPAVKRTGYAAAAAGEAAGPPPAANGAGSYRGAVTSTGLLSGLAGAPAAVPSGSGSSRTSVDSVAALLPNGGSVSSADSLYARTGSGLGAVAALPSGKRPAEAAAAEAPGQFEFGDFQHMGLISDLLE